MRVPRRTRGVEYTSDDELPMLAGDIHAMSHPYDLTDEELERLAAEVAEKERRRRPLGFAAWPDEKR